MKASIKKGMRGRKSKICLPIWSLPSYMIALSRFLILEGLKEQTWRKAIQIQSLFFLQMSIDQVRSLWKHQGQKTSPKKLPKNKNKSNWLMKFCTLKNSYLNGEGSTKIWWWHQKACLTGSDSNTDERKWEKTNWWPTKAKAFSDKMNDCSLLYEPSFRNWLFNDVSWGGVLIMDDIQN